MNYLICWEENHIKKMGNDKRGRQQQFLYELAA